MRSKLFLAAALLLALNLQGQIGQPGVHIIGQTNIFDGVGGAGVVVRGGNGKFVPGGGGGNPAGSLLNENGAALLNENGANLLNEN